MSTKIIIIRHAPTTYNKRGIFMGTKDIPPDSIPQESIDLIHTKISTGFSDVIYSSPLKRAYETAQKIAGCSYKVIDDKRLVERDLGKWQGMSKENVQKMYPDAFHGNMMDFYYLPENGEGYENLVGRVSDFLMERYLDGKNSIVVTHNGVFRVMKSLLTGEKLSDVFASQEGFLTPQLFEITDEIYDKMRADIFYTMDRK